MSTAEAIPTAAVAKRSKVNVALGERGLALDNLDAAIRFAQGLIEGGMVPKGVRSAGAVVGLIEAGKELGLAPMYALSNLTFTNGRLGIMGDAAKALIRAAGALEPGTDFEEVYSGDEFFPTWTCTVTAHRKGQPKPFSSSFSIQEGVTAGLIRVEGKKIQTFSRDGGWGDHSAPWSKYTKRMLMYRALGFLVRDRFSDFLGGAVLTEELRDYPQQEAQSAATQPPGPDPVFAMAKESEATAAPQVEEAEVISEHSERAGAEPAQSANPPVTSEQRVELSADEARLTRDIERIEGRIVSASSLIDLDAVWAEAGPLLRKLPDGEQKRLAKLLKQNRSNFEK